MPGVPQARPGFRQVKGGGMARTELSDKIMQGKQFLQRQAKNLGADADMDIADTSRNHLGVYFRYFFALVMFLLVGGLMALKLNGEFIKPPDRSDADTQAMAKEDEDLTANIMKQFDMQREARAEDEDDKKRHKRWKEEQANIKKAVAEHKAKVKSGDCDEECKAKSKAIEVLNDQVSSVVNYDYYKMFEIDSGFGLSKKEIREKFDKVKEKVEAGDPEYDHLDLEELQESYSTLMNNEARMYYNMYGRKPPPSMRVNAGGARDGGVGIHILTGTWKVRKLKAWMEHFDSAYFDLGVLGLIMFFTILPVAYNFRTMMRTMKEAFPDLDPDTADQHRDKQERLRASTYQQRRR